LSRKLVASLIALVALGASGNVILAWLAARGTPTVAGLATHPLFHLSVVLALVPWLTNTLRVGLWTRFLGQPLPWWDVFRIVLATDVGSALTPTAAGGGYAKLGLLVERGFSPGTAASLMILGSVEDYAFFALAIPTALVTSGAWRLPAIAAMGAGLGRNLVIAALVLAAVIAAVVAFRRLLARRLGRVWHDFAAAYTVIAARGKRRFVITLALTAVQWTCRYSATALLLSSLGAPVPIALVFLLQWAVFAAALVVPTPGGMVGAEAAFYVAYAPFIPPHILPAAVAGWRLLTFYGPLGLAALGFAILQYRWHRSPPPQPTPAL
jgi:uncharacterized membrane protein YbhN (UPF0104 family)